MAEMMAFNRRPRHSVSEQSAAAVAAAAGSTGGGTGATTMSASGKGSGGSSSAAGGGGAGGGGAHLLSRSLGLQLGLGTTHGIRVPPISVLTAKTPKSTRDVKARAKYYTVKPTTATSAAMARSGGGAAHRLSALQLRVFLLVCVAVYFGTIYFAGSIVAGAKWLSDADPSKQWTRRPTELLVVHTPSPSRPRVFETESHAAAAAVTAHPPQQLKEEKPQSAGRLRGPRTDPVAAAVETVHEPAGPMTVPTELAPSDALAAQPLHADIVDASDRPALEPRAAATPAAAVAAVSSRSTTATAPTVRTRVKTAAPSPPVLVVNSHR